MQLYDEVRRARVFAEFAESAATGNPVAREVAETATSPEFIRSLNDDEIRRLRRLTIDSQRAVYRAYREAPIGAADRFHDLARQAPAFVVTGEQFREFVKVGRSVRTRLSPSNVVRIFDAYVPPYENFQIVVLDRPRYPQNTDLFTYEYLGITSSSASNEWTVTIAYRLLASRGPQVNKDGIHYVSFVADLGQRRFRPDGWDPNHQHQELAREFSHRAMAAFSAFMLALNHRAVLVSATADPRRSNNKRRRRSERYVDHPCYAVVIPSKVTLRTVVSQSLQGRNVLRPHNVRGHLRRDREGIKRIAVRPHRRGAAGPIDVRRPYDARRLAPQPVE